MRIPRLRALAIAALVAGALLVPATASAAPPANDDFANATVVTSFPFTDVVDITDATFTSDDYGCSVRHQSHGLVHVHRAC